MASYNHASQRYRIIDTCLRTPGHKWNWKELSRECAEEIRPHTDGPPKLYSERTIKGDIKAMRNNEGLGYFAPIAYDRIKDTYYYTDPAYSLTECPINDADREELLRLILIMRQYSGFNFLNGIDSLIDKLSLLVEVSKDPSKEVIQLEQPTSVPGEKLLEELYKAIANENAVSIIYQRFDKEPYAAIISPYLLKEYQNRWYLIAQKNDISELRTYGLDRILEIKETFQPYQKPIGFEPKNYFKNIIGITKESDNQLETIIIKVYGYQVNYIRTRPLHVSQLEIKKGDGFSIFSINVIPNREFEIAILSYGETVEILEPLYVRNQIKSRLEEACQRY